MATKRSSRSAARPPAGYDADAFPRFAVTVDIVILAVVDDALSVLLIRRKGAPFEDHWALPGGFKRPSESLDDAARRELLEETGVTAPRHLDQFKAYGDPGRDQRTNVVPIAWGGTEATTAAGARGNLGLGTMATQNANAVAITGGTITGVSRYFKNVRKQPLHSVAVEPAARTAVKMPQLYSFACSLLEKMENVILDKSVISNSLKFFTRLFKYVREDDPDNLEFEEVIKNNLTQLTNVLRSTLLNHYEISVRKNSVQLVVEAHHFLHPELFSFMLSQFSVEHQRLIKQYIQKSLNQI